MKRKLYHFLRELFGLILLLSYFLFPFRKSKILSIYFHNPSTGLFEKLIKYLSARSYSFISMNQLLEIIDNKMVLNKSAIITFDDGWQNNLKLLEIIRKYKVSIAIFITTSAVEQGNFWWEYVGYGKHLNKASMKREVIRIKKLKEKPFFSEILNLKSGVTIDRSALTQEELVQISKEELITIGSHTVNHISLPDKSVEFQKSELLDSKKILESLTGQTIHCFSYPSGDYTMEIKKLAKECGYRICFTIETSNIDLTRIDKFSIPRRCINDDAGFFEALSKIYGIWYKIVE
jgi:peptidoglycan/xylan/chitin deacetylase (PgdA/CDA1 family)